MRAAPRKGALALTGNQQPSSRLAIVARVRQHEEAVAIDERTIFAWSLAKCCRNGVSQGEVSLADARIDHLAILGQLNPCIAFTPPDLERARVDQREVGSILHTIAFAERGRGEGVLVVRGVLHLGAAGL